jgi:hypothetical protein
MRSEQHDGHSSMEQNSESQKMPLAELHEEIQGPSADECRPDSIVDKQKTAADLELELQRLERKLDTKAML